MALRDYNIVKRDPAMRPCELIEAAVQVRRVVANTNK
jgi:hypothetical protein